MMMSAQINPPRSWQPHRQPPPALNLLPDQEPVGTALDFTFTRLSGAECLEFYASQTGLAVAELTGRGKTRKLADARSMVARHLRSLGWSTPKIGRLLNRDHTTIINLLKRKVQV